MAFSTLDAKLKKILADLDEATLRLALDPTVDERALSLMSVARRELDAVVFQLEEETRMRPVFP